MSLTDNDAERLTELSTEAADPRFAEIDRMPVADLAAMMNEVDASVPAAVARELPRITAAIEAATARMKSGGRLVYVGAGTPGRIGVLDASECPPTFSTPPEQVFAIIAGGPGAVVSPIEGAEDDPQAGASAIDDAAIGPLDTVIGIASSGRTPYVVAAVRRARERGALTVGLSCNPDTLLSAAAEYGIEVLVGPELISGSTRLKAGTAQKLVLNMFSTIIMVQLGKTYGNLMVDVKATNVKLRERAIRIVRSITNTDREGALTALRSAGFNVKRAVLALRLGLSDADARAALDEADGSLRAALEEQR
ncbi:N-acetylmuramic acid 6-phosphate etherase [Cryobacterium tepidiphilum]|jgi:N-acetylmuramic acid 6-phosphate etherase|uniref:N-acetylmuramic acid 6-phosphate etherase n=1 Tax=Cryobacterium tepidiphilum TaxID=2486026 RepID=A0A3M8LGV0_9MICO|nr:N-acetylmuramic acid 6-phosphate etherase [Cryobacterium tepidiphilum]RNE64129.1 N-acetylmuramic acid 6-phosphate etherase [Cryobacterium tepidiphilum]